jgi:hypothetical protein
MLAVLEEVVTLTPIRHQAKKCFSGADATAS